MPKPKQNSTTTPNNGAPIAYEAQLWQMAVAPRGSTDAAEYKRDPCPGSSGMFVRSVEFIRATPAGNANFAWVQYIAHHGAGNGPFDERGTRRSGVA